MRSPFCIFVSGIWILLSQVSPAIVDSNTNGLSDLWEKYYNSGSVFSALDPQADPDGDGWSNAQEAAAGTHPLNPNPPAGILYPNTLYSPESWADSDGDGILEHTPAIVTLTWVMRPGKQYTVLYSPDLSEGSWQALGESFIGNGNEVEVGLPFTQPDGANPENCFWRVAVTDIDSDEDRLTNAEEHQIGSNPAAWDTDNDGINDFDEYQLSTNPTIPRIWAFKETRNPDDTVTFTWKSYASNGAWFNIESQQSNGIWQTIYSTTYGSTKIPFVTGSNNYSLTLNPASDYQP